VDLSALTDYYVDQRAKVKSILLAKWCRVLDLLNRKHIARVDKDYIEKIIANQGQAELVHKLTSKRLRTMDCDVKKTCLKLECGLDDESINLYLNRVKSLKSTRHKNAVLRVWNGDIISRNRLVNMGLADDNICQHCGEIETQIHVVKNCQRAQTLWWNIKANIDPPLQDGWLEEWHGINDNDFELRAECLWHLLNNKELSAKAILDRSCKYLEKIRNFKEKGYGDINISDFI